MSEEKESTALSFVHKVFPAGHFVISMMFVVCSVALLTFAVVQFSAGVNPAADFPIDSFPVRRREQSHIPNVGKRTRPRNRGLPGTPART